MSKRRISENLSYEVDNEGLEYETDGVINITATTINVNSQPVVTGSVTGSSSINVGVVPGRVLTDYWPRMVQLFKNNIAISADTGTSIDWGGPTVQVDNFGIVPQYLGNTNYTGFIHHIGSGQYGFTVKGLWRVEFLLNLGGTATIDELTEVKIRFRAVAAAAFTVIGQTTGKRTTGDTGVGQFLSVSSTVWIDPTLATDDQRIDIFIVSGQALVSGTAEYTLKFILLKAA